MTHNEYAVIDNKGVLFGLPAKTFTEPEAAALVLEQLQKTRERLKDEAEQASRRLRSGEAIGKAQLQAELEETVARWRREQPRTWTVFGRTVTPWEAQVHWGALMST